MNIPSFKKSQTVSPASNKAAPNIETPRHATECFRKTIRWNNSDVSVLYVPLFKQTKENKEANKVMYVGPGYWKPLERAGVIYEKPPFEYNTREYSREELLRAGATPVQEYIWPRS